MPANRQKQISPALPDPGPERRTGFFSRVHALVAAIPPGRVMTYGQISRLLDSACSARYVGYALSAAPDGLPCHRVVNRRGEPAPGDIFGGPERQRALLKAEGVLFLPDGRIDLAASLFDPVGAHNLDNIRKH